MTTESDSLKDLRQRIADVDSRIVEAVAERMGLSTRIGRVKSAERMEIEIREIEKAVFERVKDKGHEMGVDEELVERLFHLLIEYSKKEQRRELGNDPDRDPGT